MTVEKWLRGHFQGMGSQIEQDVLEVAAVSPASVIGKQFRAIGLNEDYFDLLGDATSEDSLNYALSTLFYSMSSAITGGTKSERNGNRQISLGGYPLTTRDREAFRSRADQIRKALGCEVQESEAEGSVMFDATSYSSSKPSKRCC